MTTYFTFIRILGFVNANLFWTNQYTTYRGSRNDVPIIYSDDKYVKEQFQDATYKLDLDNVDSLVDVLLKFATNKENTEEKLKHYEKIKLKLSCAKNFEILETMINEFMNKKGDSWKI